MMGCRDGNETAEWKTAGQHGSGGGGHLPQRPVPRLPLRRRGAVHLGGGHPGRRPIVDHVRHLQVGWVWTLSKEWNTDEGGGCCSGQFVMEGFLNLHWARWKRVLLTRCIAIVPTLALAVFADLREMTSLNDYLNAVMSLQLPFALIPVLTFTSSSRIMGQFANGIVTKVVISLLVVVIIAINFFFVGSTISSALPNAHWAVYTAIGLVAALYLLLVVYTCVHLLVALDLPGFHRLPVSRSSVSLLFFRFFLPFKFCVPCRRFCVLYVLTCVLLLLLLLFLVLLLLLFVVSVGRGFKVRHPTWRPTPASSAPPPSPCWPPSTTTVDLLRRAGDRFFLF